MQIEIGSYRLVVEPVGDCVRVSVGRGSSGHGVLLTRDEARMLHTDLGEMLGTFELSEDACANS